MIELITKNEEKMIDFSALSYGTRMIGTSRLASLSHRLRFWESAKQNLFHLLGDKLIVEKEIDASLDTAVLENTIAKKINIDDDLRIFTEQYRDNVLALYHSGAISYDTYAGLRRLIYTETLASGICRINIPKFVLNEKEITIQGSAKVVKTLGKIAELIGMDKEIYENFRLKMSVLTNQNNVKGRLCLSIHPLDYITMSDNESDWSSCMSWVDKGCYRAGTVEMMNSPYVLVAYLKSKDDMVIDNYTWNNKKWRVLVIFDGNHAITIKDYPYYSATMNNAVLEWIRELAKENLGIDLSKGIYTRSSTYEPDSADGNMSFEYYTDQMYNDFWYTTHHFICTEDFNGCSLNYSGVKNCMICGEDISMNDYEEREAQICCEDCLGIVHCAHCGCSLDSSDYYREVDGELICSNCLESECIRINGVYHFIKNCSYVYIIPDELFDENDKPLFSTTYGEFNYPYMILHNDDIGNERIMNITDYKLHKFTMGNREWGITRYAICNDAITDFGADYIC